MNTLSWQTPTKPLPMEINPRVVFERMFGWESTKDQRLARLRTDRSVLDVVTADLSDLSRAVGPSDRARLDEYLEHVRGTERRIQQAERRARTEIAVPQAPVGVPESFEDHAQLLFDLLALAYETDQTRVFTFMLCREFSVRTYPNIDVTEPHHTVSHTQGRAALIAAHTRVNTYHLQLFARFLQRLQATPDGDGSLLDHSTIVYGSGMGDGNVHAPSPLPMAVVGGRRVPGGRHIVLPEKTPLPNLLVGVAARVGVELPRFGVSTGTRGVMRHALLLLRSPGWLDLASRSARRAGRRIPAGGCREARGCRRRSRAAARSRRRQRARGRRHHRPALGRAGRRRGARADTHPGRREGLRREPPGRDADGAGGHQRQRSPPGPLARGRRQSERGFARR